MGNIDIIKVTTKKDRKTFAHFGNELYKDSEYAVPDLEFDVLDTFDPKKNAAYDFCEAELFLARKDGKVVGRVAAIINHRANETWNVRNVRFGYLDFIDDMEVSAALLKTVEDWGRERGMTSIQGPMGFTDFDKEGMLVEGFDKLGSLTALYNYPYYVSHMDAHGYGKEVDWVQIRVAVPEGMPDKFKRGAEMIMRRYGLKIRKLTAGMVLRQGYGQKIFDLLNAAYAPLFGFSQLSQRQIDSYVKTYFGLEDLKFVTLVLDKDDNLIGVAVTMNSLARAIRKAKGRIFPFGWFHLLRALKFKMEDTVEMILIAIKPEYQGKGVNSLFFYDLIPIYQKAGFKYAETAPQLEENLKELNQWRILNPEFPKRRRCYCRKL